MKSDVNAFRAYRISPFLRSAMPILAALGFAQAVYAIDAGGGPGLVDCGVLQRGRTNQFEAKFVLASNNADHELIRPTAYLADLEGATDSDFFMSFDPVERVLHYEWPDTTNGFRFDPVIVYVRPLGSEGATGPGGAHLWFNVCMVDPGGGIGVGAGVMLVIRFHVLPATASLALGEIADQEVNEGEEVAFPVPLQLTDIPEDLVEFHIAGADGAVVDPTNRVFRWSPREDQGPGTNFITLRAGVRGDSFSLFNVTNSFRVIVHEVNNHAPVLDPMPPQTVAEGTTFVQAIRASDGDQPSLCIVSIENAPAGVEFDSASGLLRWCPTEADGPSTNTVTLRVSDDGSPSLSSTQSYEFVVSEINRPPVLFPFPDQVLYAGRTLTIPLLGEEHHGALWETYEEIGDPTVEALTSHPRFPDLAGHARFVTDWLEAPLRSGATYGQRLRAYVLPPVSGAYVFWIASMQNSVLYLSPDEDPAHRVPVANVIGWVTPRSWDGQTNQQSAPVWLEAGKAYYLEAVMGEMMGDWAHLAVRWQLPDQTIEEPIPASRLRIPTPGAVDSDLPTNSLAIWLETAPPGMSLDPVSGLLTWTPSLEQAPSTNIITVCVADDGSPSLSSTQRFTVIVRTNTAPILLIPDQTIAEGETLTLVPRAEHGLVREVYEGIYGWGVDDLLSDTRFPDRPTNVGLLTNSFEAPSNVGDFYGQRIYGWLVAPVSGPYVFELLSDDEGLLYFSSNANPANKVTLLRGYAEQSAPVSLTAGKVYYMEALMKECFGGDRLAIRWRHPDTAEFTAIPASHFLLSNRAVDFDDPPNTLTLELLEGPAGMGVDPTSGSMTWRPTELYGPSTNEITVRVTDDGIPPLSATNQFTVVVREVNSPPQLAPIADQSVRSNLVLQLTASDDDWPTNALSFELVSGPVGVAVDRTSGLLTWTPAPDQRPSTNAVTITVADDGVPCLSVTQTFNVIVRSTLPPRVTDLQLLANGVFHVLWSSEAGYPCVIEGSTNLQDWVPVATNLANALGVLEFRDAEAVHYVRRFYRARQD